MKELGLFDGDVRALNDKWAREDAAELKKHLRMVRTFLKKQTEHEKLLARRPRWHIPRRYSDKKAGEGTLKHILEIEMKHLEWAVN